MDNIEIERKWLIAQCPVDLNDCECLEIEQAYLSVSPTVRIRKENDTYYLTYKNSGKDEAGLAHTEYNLPLDRESYEHLKEKKDGILISKKRYLIPLDDGHTLELDVFEGTYAGLIIAEVEFDSEEEAYAFKAPEWFGEDVSGIAKYKNAYMALYTA